jgi:hypothetical protein
MNENNSVNYDNFVPEGDSIRYVVDDVSSVFFNIFMYGMNLLIVLSVSLFQGYVYFGLFITGVMCFICYFVFYRRFDIKFTSKLIVTDNNVVNFLGLCSGDENGFIVKDSSIDDISEVEEDEFILFFDSVDLVDEDGESIFNVIVRDEDVEEYIISAKI